MAQAKRSFNQYSLFVPESNWNPPTELPDLSNEKEIAIDVETKDPFLANDKGPGFYAYERNNSNTGGICGISAAWRNQAIYVPLRHYNTKCFEHEPVQRWLASLANQVHTRYIFHNFQYDWGWIEAVFDIRPPALIDDTAAMASMLDENQSSFSLDSLCHWQGLPGKDEKLLRETMAAFGVDKESEVKANLWQLEGKYVGPYGEADAVSTLSLAMMLRPKLYQENLYEAYQLECDLMPITLKMKQRGIRVDIHKTQTIKKRVIEETQAAIKKLGDDIGQKIDINNIRSSRWLRQQFETLDLKFPETGLGNPNFDKVFMADHPHWFPRTVYQIKHRRDLAERFLEKFIENYEYRGRVYPSVNQFRSEWGGARSHRFSYSDPPLQQMPSRDDELAQIIRSCFIPEDGETWYSIDYRQQEYRLIVFVAELVKKKGAKAAADRYRNNPDTDYHDWVAEITRLPRRRAKDVNFAKSYGAGVKKFALMTGMSLEEAEKTMKQYDEALPFVRDASEHYARFAQNNGYIKLIDGARNHFNQWEPVFRDFSKEYSAKAKDSTISTQPCSEEEYNRRKEDPAHPWYGERGKRAYTHKAFNRMIQGSAARQIKRAMRDIHRAGYHMLLQLHDELAFSFDSEAKARECAKMMEECVPAITIPMLTDIKGGPSWGELKKLK